ncbi:MAG TPA: carbamoyl phosphate synthase large subunit, partial [Clostridiales bacterium]|nr:carbamoyl phosphate synthase large subunit [Clostridiales bacterium]
LDKYVPGGDYVVIKFARWAFEKFRGVKDHLGTQMRAVGEVMSIGKTYQEAFQKAIRSLETGRYGLGFAKDYHQKTKEELLSLLQSPTSERQFILYEAIRKGATSDELYALTKIKHYFLDQMRALVEEENTLLTYKNALPDPSTLLRAKQHGFSDKYLAKLWNQQEETV